MTRVLSTTDHFNMNSHNKIALLWNRLTALVAWSHICDHFSIIFIGEDVAHAVLMLRRRPVARMKALLLLFHVALWYSYEAQRGKKLWSLSQASYLWVLHLTPFLHQKLLTMAASGVVCSEIMLPDLDRWLKLKPKTSSIDRWMRRCNGIAASHSILVVSKGHRWCIFIIDALNYLARDKVVVK